MRRTASGKGVEEAGPKMGDGESLVFSGGDEKGGGATYNRNGSVRVASLSKQLSARYNVKTCFVLPSGMAAISTLMHSLLATYKRNRISSTDTRKENGGGGGAGDGGGAGKEAKISARRATLGRGPPVSPALGESKEEKTTSTTRKPRSELKRARENADDWERVDRVSGEFREVARELVETEERARETEALAERLRAELQHIEDAGFALANKRNALTARKLDWRALHALEHARALREYEALLAQAYAEVQERYRSGVKLGRQERHIANEIRSEWEQMTSESETHRKHKAYKNWSALDTYYLGRTPFDELGDAKDDVKTPARLQNATLSEEVADRGRQLLRLELEYKQADGDLEDAEDKLDALVADREELRKRGRELIAEMRSAHIHHAKEESVTSKPAWIYEQALRARRNLDGLLRKRML